MMLVFKVVQQHDQWIITPALTAPLFTSETHPQRCAGFCALRPAECALRWKWSWLCASCSAPRRPGRGGAKTTPMTTFWSRFRVTFSSSLASCADGKHGSIHTRYESALLIIHPHNATTVLWYYQDILLKLAESYSILNLDVNAIKFFMLSLCCEQVLTKIMCVILWTIKKWTHCIGKQSFFLFCRCHSVSLMMNAEAKPLTVNCSALCSGWVYSFKSFWTLNRCI